MIFGTLKRVQVYKIGFWHQRWKLVRYLKSAASLPISCNSNSAAFDLAVPFLWCRRAKLSRAPYCRNESINAVKWLAASLKVKALRHHGSFHLLQSDQFFSGDPIPSLGLSYNSTHSFNYSQWALKLLKYAIFVRINNEIIDAIMTRIKGSFQAFRKERVLSAEVDN